MPEISELKKKKTVKSGRTTTEKVKNTGSDTVKKNKKISAAEKSTSKIGSASKRGKSIKPKEKDTAGKAAIRKGKQTI